MPSCFILVTSSFADDTRVTRKMNRPTQEDTVLLQEDLNTIYRWAAENNMLFNESKFEALRYGSNNNIKEHTYYNTTQDPIDVMSDLRDLQI
ncbi:hypothetical protein Pcinc_033886 [Petrolisthes cinctipes]|uniref:Uncharacterized protein n=1 Tax=Petrolisthes cinctipes TaxID=88211 RepID=A0AAE1ERF0_PETCI|nr:hypothetical protein Pcinc_033886 [Petrolisthes cinctipes]